MGRYRGDVGEVRGHGALLLECLDTAYRREAHLVRVRVRVSLRVSVSVRVSVRVSVSVRVRVRVRVRAGAHLGARHAVERGHHLHPRLLGDIGRYREIHGRY